MRLAAALLAAGLMVGCGHVHAQDQGITMNSKNISLADVTKAANYAYDKGNEAGYIEGYDDALKGDKIRIRAILKKYGKELP